MWFRRKTPGAVLWRSNLGGHILFGTVNEKLIITHYCNHDIKGIILLSIRLGMLLGIKLYCKHNFQGISRTEIFTNHYNFKGFDNFTHSASLTIIHQSPGWALDDIFRWPFQQDWCFLESQVACLPLLGISSKLSLPALNLCYHLWTGVFARLIHRKRYFIWAQHRQQMSPFSSKRL